MTNPFVYGEVVPPASFVDREVELDRLAGDLLAGQKVFLISPRRYGKSSLVRQALARGGAQRRADRRGHGQQLQLVRGVPRGLRPRAARRSRRGSTARAPGCASMLGGVRPEVRVEPDERGVGAARGVVPRRPHRRATCRAWRRRSSRCRAGSPRRGGRKLAVALDEFQAIAAFNGGSVEHALRAAVQHQRAGRLRVRRLGAEPDGADARPQPPVLQGRAGDAAREDSRPIASPTSSRRASARRDLRPDAGLGAAIVELAGNLPYDVQRLAHEIWDDVRGGRSRSGLDDLHETLKRLLGEHETMFEGTWQRLTLAQRAALRAAVLEEGRELLSADVRARYRLGGASTVQASLAALVREDVLAREGARYTVVDSLLREWVARQTH